MFITSILRCLKKIKYLQKYFIYFQVLELYKFQIVANFYPIQVFASNLKKYDYNNLTFEIHVNKVRK